MATIELSVATGAVVNAQAKAEPERWKMPRPRFGLVSWRFSDGSGSECYAVVTAVYEHAIDVMLFPSNHHTPRPALGVKHVSDPSLKKMQAPNPGGVWDVMPMERSFEYVLSRLSEVSVLSQVCSGHVDEHASRLRELAIAVEFVAKSLEEGGKAYRELDERVTALENSRPGRPGRRRAEDDPE